MKNSVKYFKKTSCICIESKYYHKFKCNVQLQACDNEVILTYYQAKKKHHSKSTPVISHCETTFEAICTDQIKLQHPPLRRPYFCKPIIHKI